MSYESVRFEREETEHGILAHVTLNRPEVRNAIDLTFDNRKPAILVQIVKLVLRDVEPVLTADLPLSDRRFSRTRPARRLPDRIVYHAEIVASGISFEAK